MLEIRPNCEACDKDLAYNSTDAMICSYECTFCRTCVDEILNNVCPNCGGGFCSRPIRPKTARREGLSINHQLASQKRVNTKYSNQEIKDFVKLASDIEPKDR